MKKLLVLLLVLGGAYLAYQKFVGSGKSGEMGQVRALADDFAAIKQQLAQAERSAGATGMDMTSEADGAAHAAETLLERLQALQEGLAEDQAIQKAGELEADIKAFLDRNR